MQGGRLKQNNLTNGIRLDCLGTVEPLWPTRGGQVITKTAYREKGKVAHLQCRHGITPGPRRREIEQSTVAHNVRTLTGAATRTGVRERACASLANSANGGGRKREGKTTSRLQLECAYMCAYTAWTEPAGESDITHGDETGTLSVQTAYSLLPCPPVHCARNRTKGKQPYHHTNSAAAGELLLAGRAVHISGCRPESGRHQMAAHAPGKPFH